MAGVVKKGARSPAPDVEPGPGPAEPDPVMAGLVVGSKVWFADRSHGRVTEHLAEVAAVTPKGLRLLVRDQGEVRVFEAMQPWGPDSVQGWWRT